MSIFKDNHIYKLQVFVLSFTRYWILIVESVLILQSSLIYSSKATSYSILPLWPFQILSFFTTLQHTKYSIIHHSPTATDKHISQNGSGHYIIHSRDTTQCLAVLSPPCVKYRDTAVVLLVNEVVFITRQAHNGQERYSG